MIHLEEIAERIRESFDAKTSARDQTLTQTRTIIRHCANAIRAAHRDEHEQVLVNLESAKQLVNDIQSNLKDYPDLLFAGYTQDAFKEYAEANITYSLVNNRPLPNPEEINIPYATYLQGLAESAGELRRRCLDNLRSDRLDDAERLLSFMDDIYAVLITMDYPNAITGGLRRLTDIVRAVTERTRGDLTLSLRQEQLRRSLENFEKH